MTESIGFSATVELCPVCGQPHPNTTGCPPPMHLPVNMLAGYAAGFRDGCLAMREAAAEKIKSGRVAINTMHVSQELIRNDPVSAIQLIAADAELATRLQIVQVIRELALPEK